MNIRMILGAIILVLTFLSAFKHLAFIVILAILIIAIVLWIIRKIADIFWSGRDKGNW